MFYVLDQNTWGSCLTRMIFSWLLWLVPPLPFPYICPTLKTFLIKKRQIKFFHVPGWSLCSLHQTCLDDGNHFVLRIARLPTPPPRREIVYRRCRRIRSPARSLSLVMSRLERMEPGRGQNCKVGFIKNERVETILRRLEGLVNESKI